MALLNLFDSKMNFIHDVPAVVEMFNKICNKCLELPRANVFINTTTLSIRETLVNLILSGSFNIIHDYPTRNMIRKDTDDEKIMEEISLHIREVYNTLHNYLSKIIHDKIFYLRYGMHGAYYSVHICEEQNEIATQYKKSDLVDIMHIIQRELMPIYGEFIPYLYNDAIILVA